MTDGQAPVPSSLAECGQVVLLSSAHHRYHVPQEGETHCHVPCIPSTPATLMLGPPGLSTMSSGERDCTSQNQFLTASI